MITVGYGDVLPKTPPELILCVITMIIACGLFGYSLNQIGVIVQDVFKTETEIRENLYVITNYMNTKHINFDLQFQIRQYVEYYHREQSQNNTEMESKIINQLSDFLRESLKYEANKLVTNSPIFYNHFSQEVMQKMVPLIKEKRSTPEESIYIENEHDDCCIYFVEKGIIDEIIDMNDSKNDYNRASSKVKVIKSYEDGEYFGELNFFTGFQRKQSARSRQFTKLLYIRRYYSINRGGIQSIQKIFINREDFINLLKDHKDDYEVFCFLRDKLTLYNDLEVIGKKCQSCFSYHLIDECQWVHFAPEKQKIIHRHLISFPQVRKKEFRRRRKLKFSCLIYNDFIKRKVNTYLENQANQLLEYDWYYDLMNMSDFTLDSDDQKKFQNQLYSTSEEEEETSINLIQNFKEDKSIYTNQNSDTDYEHKQKQYQKRSDSEIDEIGKEGISTLNIKSKVQLKKECNKNSKNQYLTIVQDKSKQQKQSLLSPRDTSKSHQSEQRRKSMKQKATKILNNIQDQITNQQNNDNLLKVHDQIKNYQDKSISSHNQQPHAILGKQINNHIQNQPLNTVIDQFLQHFSHKKLTPYSAQLQSPSLVRQSSNNISSQQNQQNPILNALFTILSGATQNIQGNAQNNTLDQAQLYHTIDDAGFEVIGQFKYYFPYGNFQNVIEQIEKIALFKSMMSDKLKKQLQNTCETPKQADKMAMTFKQEMYLNSNDEFSKRFSTNNIRPSFLRSGLLNEKKQLFRQNLGVGKSLQYRQSNLTLAKAKPVVNSKIQNLIEKFKYEENSSQQTVDQMNVSTDLQNQKKLMQRRQQIRNKMTMINLPRFKKLSQGETQLFSPSSIQNLILKKKSQFDMKQSSFENSNVGLEPTFGNLSNRKESQNTMQSQQNEEDQFYLKQASQKSPSQLKYNSSKNGDLISFNLNVQEITFDDNNADTPLQSEKKKSLFNQKKLSEDIEEN